MSKFYNNPTEDMAISHVMRETKVQKNRRSRQRENRRMKQSARKNIPSVRAGKEGVS